MTAKARVQLPCGCVEIVDFDHGQRLVYCPGGGTTPTNGKVSPQQPALWQVTDSGTASIELPVK